MLQNKLLPHSLRLLKTFDPLRCAGIYRICRAAVLYGLGGGEWPAIQR